MLTAAHCIDSSKNGGIYFVPGDAPDLTKSNFKRIKASSAFHLGLTFDDFDDEVAVEDRVNDIAVIVFPAETAPAVTGIAPTRPALLQRVTMVGYGATQLVDEDIENVIPRKREGSNVVRRSTGNGFSDLLVEVGFVSAEQSADGARDGSTAMASKGDSGGPILVDGAIAGIASRAGAGGSSPTLYFASYASPLSQEAQSLFSRARKAGAVIPKPGESPRPLVKAAALPSSKCP
jgi:hypothetical protein